LGTEGVGDIHFFWED